MVAWPAIGSVALLLAQQAKEMSPPTRAIVLMALLGIALVGLMLVVMVLLGGHWVRRLGNHRRGPSVPPDRAPLPTHIDKPTRITDAPVQSDTVADQPGGETLAS